MRSRGSVVPRNEKGPLPKEEPITNPLEVDHLPWAGQCLSTFRAQSLLPWVRQTEPIPIPHEEISPRSVINFVTRTCGVFRKRLHFGTAILLAPVRSTISSRWIHGTPPRWRSPAITRTRKNHQQTRLDQFQRTNPRQIRW
jgi:hypothetical protein